MKRLLLYLFVSLLIITISGFFIPQTKNGYAESWKKVEKFVDDGLPRSALKVIDAIYKEAKAEGNEPQVIKSLIYRVSLQSRFEEQHLEGAIKTFEKELESAKSPEKQILHSLLAELYNWYYQSNKWQINERGVVADFQPKDITTWDAVMINKTIRDHYLKSVENAEELEKIQLKDFEAILSKTDAAGYSLWPTLYDLLANRALDYFSFYDAGLADIGNDNSLNNDYLLLPVKQFVELKFEGIDTTSGIYTVLRLYQHLLTLHLREGNTAALVDLDLKRLQYVMNNVDQSETSTEAYISTLEKLREEMKNDSAFVKVSLALARQYVKKGNSYKTLANDEDRYDLNKAEQICKEAIEAFPESTEIAACKDIINDINKKEFDFRLESAVIPEKPSLAYISYRNTDKLYFKVVTVDPNDFLKNNAAKRDQKIRNYLSNPVVQKWFKKLPNTGDHQKHTTEGIVQALDPGFYMVFASQSPEFESDDLTYCPVWVTRLSYISKIDADGNIELFVLDRESGQPVGNVHVEAYEKVYNPKTRSIEYKHAGNFVTDKNGYALLELGDQVKNTSVSFMLEIDCQLLFSESDLYVYRKATYDRTVTHTYLFTDRAIYRPGQMVYFKGIVVDRTGDRVAIKTDYSTSVEFRNVNRKVISTLDVKTNDFGSFHGAFIIPKGGLNGQMTLKTPKGSVSFLVEEYKRPTYEVTFDTLKGEYKLGEELTVTGKAENFSGSSVMNAEVKYRVVRQQVFIPYRGYFMPYRPYPYRPPVEIAHGKTVTDENGNFEVTFLAESGKSSGSFKSNSYQFTVFADVTDVTGEVQSASTSVAVGEKALMLSLDLKDKIRKEANKGITVEAKNISGVPVKTNVRVELYKYETPVNTFIKRYWPKPDTVTIDKEQFETAFPNLAYQNEDEEKNWKKNLILSKEIAVNGSADILKESLQNADIGEYLVAATAVSSNGDTTEVSRSFTLFSEETNKLPGNPAAWFDISKDKADPGETIQLAIGSATKKARIFYEIVNGDELVERGWITVNNGQKIIDIPVRESYRGNFTVNVNLIRLNREYKKSYLVEVPFTNKKLTVKLETHRDYLSPGKKEEWQVKISGPDGEPLAAELLAGMYDASLDQFRANTWDMNLYPTKQSNSIWKSGYYNAKRARELNPHRPLPLNVKTVQYPGIDWYDYRRYSARPPILRNVEMSLAADGGVKLEEAENKDKKPGETNANVSTIGGKYLEDSIESLEENKDKEELIPLRTNFNETAFFYPQLRTDSLGNVAFSFTTPDALTEWKVMMLAHTKNLKVGKLVENIKANKELMVIPNLPRFIRQGDKLVFSVKVVNFTDENLSPEVIIEFFDPISMKTVSLFSANENNLKRINLKPKQSALVSWDINIPYDLDLLAYRIKASTNEFTDGEERMIPVLTNRMLVTETMPMPVKAKESIKFTLKDLAISDKVMAVSTRKNYLYTVEFTSNPAWYAVQALPYLNEPRVENASNLFHRYYANALSAFIVNSNPRIKGVFESWKEITPESFYSNLQKNEELKNAVFEATPWVLEAENESEQKRRIGMLFDMNRMLNELDNTIAKLQASQLPNGAWPWFKGMHEDRHTTQQIVLGIGRLVSKNVISLSSDRDLMHITRRAVDYLDSQIVEDYEKLKKNNPKGMKDNQLSSSQVEYLYARSLLSEQFPVPSKAQTAFDYYIGQAKQYWLKKSNYLQGMIAITMLKFGYRNEAEGIMRSLKERALFSDEMGMYWRQNVSWRWYEAPVETQAMLIEAFEQVTSDAISVEQMKVWLLKQKQTTSWKTTSATADAVYALLLNGQDLLNEDKRVEVKVGRKALVPEEIEGTEVEAGTGYFKTSWKGDEIKAEMGNIEVTNPNNNIAWGAAYWQYFENLDRIKSQDTPLTIEKLMFVEELTDDGPVMKPMQNGQQLKTGDKVIIRLVIGTDRDLEYVHLKDMRASALEPMDQLSGYSYKAGIGFYRNVTDVATEFFIQYMRKGTYVLEYPLMVTQKGEFSNGIATIQSFYAPEFAAHSEGKRLVVR